MAILKSIQNGIEYIELKRVYAQRSHTICMKMVLFLELCAFFVHCARVDALCAKMRYMLVQLFKLFDIVLIYSL